MIQVEVNGARRELEPGSIDELRGYLNGAVPTDEVICVLRVNGEEISEEDLLGVSVPTIRTLEIKSARPQSLAQSAIPEAVEWMQRLSEVLRSVAEDYRIGEERRGAERLIPVSDALQVLVGLLSGIREFGLDPEAETALAAPWEDAVSNLRNTLDAFLTEFEGGDSIRMADLLGHDLPEVLGRFIHMLGAEGK